MIVEAIFNLLKLVILLVIGLFPDIPSLGSSSSVNPLFDVLRAVNSFVSVPLVGFCVAALFVFLNADFLWSIIMWVVRKIPGVE